MTTPAFIRQLRQKVGHELLLLPSVTGLVWHPDGRLLLIRHRKSDDWTLPGGIVEPGEFPAKTLIREIWEEAGVLAKPIRVIRVFGGPEGFRRTYSNRDAVEFIDILFSCVARDGEPQCRDNETAEARYFTRDGLDKLRTSYPIPLADLVFEAAPVFAWDDAWLADLDEPTSHN